MKTLWSFWLNYSSKPQHRFKQLQLGVGLFFFGVLFLYAAAELEWQWLFYVGAVWMSLAILFTLPAYLAILYWRIKSIGDDRKR